MNWGAIIIGVILLATGIIVLSLALPLYQTDPSGPSYNGDMHNAQIWSGAGIVLIIVGIAAIALGIFF